MRILAKNLRLLLRGCVSEEVSMNILCLIFGHNFNICHVCVRCGDNSEARHNWSGCHCKNCTANNHVWDGCFCRNCSAESHSWTCVSEACPNCMDGATSYDGAYRCGSCGGTGSIGTRQYCSQCGKSD